MTISSTDAIDLARRICREKYGDAAFSVAAGSIIRGVGTAYSDIDLTVISKKIPNAYRESYVYDGVQIEAFVHDFETIQAFIDTDIDAGRCPMIVMLASGVVVPEETPESRKIQAYARKLLTQRPLKTPEEELKMMRYFVCDQIDDLRGDRPAVEKRAVLYALYNRLTELYFAHHQLYAGSGKYVARFLTADSPSFMAKLDDIMVRGHTTGVTPADIDMLLDMIKPFGGYLFDGYRHDAPADKRVQPRWLAEDK